MPFDLKGFYEQNKSYFGDKPLADVAQEIYQKSGSAKKHSFDDWLDWTGSGRQQLEEDSLNRQVVKNPSGILRRGLADPLISLVGKGGVGIYDTAAGLANLATGGLVEKGINRIQEAAGYTPGTVEKTLESMYSPEQQIANKKVQDVDGFIPTVKASLENPSTILHTTLESLPAMVAGGVGIGGGSLKLLSKVAPKLAATKGAGIAAGALGEGLVTAGQQAEQIRSELPNRELTAEGAGAALASGAMTGLLSLVGGKVANKLGFNDLDTMLASKMRGDVKKGIADRIGKFVGGGIAEGVLEEMPQSAQEQIWTNLATGKPWDEGVGKAAGQGMLAGMAMGAGANVIQGREQPATVPTRDKSPVTTPNWADQKKPSGPISNALANAGVVPAPVQDKTDTVLGGTTPEEVARTDAATEPIVTQPPVVETAVPEQERPPVEQIASTQKVNRDPWESATSGAFFKDDDYWRYKQLVSDIEQQKKLVGGFESKPTAAEENGLSEENDDLSFEKWERKARSASYDDVNDSDKNVQIETPEESFQSWAAAARKAVYADLDKLNQERKAAADLEEAQRVQSEIAKKQKRALELEGEISKEYDRMASSFNEQRGKRSLNLGGMAPLDRYQKAVETVADVGTVQDARDVLQAIRDDATQQVRGEDDSTTQEKPPSDGDERLADSSPMDAADMQEQGGLGTSVEDMREEQDEINAGGASELAIGEKAPEAVSEVEAGGKPATIPKSVQINERPDGTIRGVINSSSPDTAEAVDYLISRGVQDISVKNTLEKHKTEYANLATEKLKGLGWTQWGFDKSVWLSPNYKPNETLISAGYNPTEQEGAQNAESQETQTLLTQTPPEASPGVSDETKPEVDGDGGASTGQPAQTESPKPGTLLTNGPDIGKFHLRDGKPMVRIEGKGSVPFTEAWVKPTEKVKPVDPVKDNYDSPQKRNERIKEVGVRMKEYGVHFQDYDEFNEPSTGGSFGESVRKWMKGETEEVPLRIVGNEFTPARTAEKGILVSQKRKADSLAQKIGAPVAYVIFNDEQGVPVGGAYVEMPHNFGSSAFDTILPDQTFNGSLRDDSGSLKSYTNVHYIGKPTEKVNGKLPGSVTGKRPEVQSPKKGEIGGMLGSGEVVLTATDRKTTPFPKVSTETNGKTQNTIKRVEKWLIENAIEEAKSRGDDFNLLQFKNINLKNLSVADKDSAEMYLFGEKQPTVVKSILKGLDIEQKQQPSQSTPTTPPEDVAEFKHDPDNEFNYFGTEVTVTDDLFGEQYDAIVQRVLNSFGGGIILEVAPTDKKFNGATFRVNPKQAKVTKLVTYEKEGRAAEKPQPTVIPTMKEKSAYEIADELAEQGVHPQASYGLFVKERGLKPEMDAKEWLKIYKSSMELAKTPKSDTTPPNAAGEAQEAEGVQTDAPELLKSAIDKQFTGAPIPITDLRAQFPDMSKQEFDDALKQIVKPGQGYQTASHAYPGGLTQAEKDGMVKFDDKYDPGVEKYWYAVFPVEKAKTATPQNKPDTLISISENDIPYQVAHDAHRGTSWTPDVRAKQVQADFVSEMTEIHDEILKGISPEQREDAAAELTAFKQGFKQKYIAWLSAKSKVASTMITGGSNFNVKRNEKANAVEDKRFTEMNEWKNKAVKGMRKRLGLDRGSAISSDDADAVDKLKDKIKTAEENHEKMKAVNAILRDKSISDAEKIAKVQADLGYNEKVASELLKPDYAGRIGIAAFNLTNNLANIKRMKDRVAVLEKSRAEATTETEKNGVRIVDNVEDNRLQLFFDGKPSNEIRDTLKANGFKWSPKSGAWQRQRSSAAKNAANEIVGGMTPIADEKITLETSGDGVTVSVDMPKSEEKKLTPKEQKAYLLAEIDKAKKALAKGGKGDSFVFEVPGDGQFTIPRSAVSLGMFERVVMQKFPDSNTMPKNVGVPKPLSVKESGKRIAIEDVNYYNAFKHRKQAIITGKDKNDNVYKDGWYVNTKALAIKADKPTGIQYRQGELPDITQLFYTDGVPAEIVGEFSYGTPEKDGSIASLVHILAEDGTFAVTQGKFADAILTKYPKAKVLIKSETDPILFEMNGEIVGLVTAYTDDGKMQKTFAPRIKDVTGKDVTQKPEDSQIDFSDRQTTTTQTFNKITAQQAKAEFKDLLDTLAESGNVNLNIAENPSDITDERLKKEIQAHERKTHRYVRGFFHKPTGTLYVFTDRMSNMDEVAETIVHELIGHHGLYEFMGDDLKPFLDFVSGHEKYGAQIKETAANRGIDLSTEIGREKAAKEWFAELIEAGDIQPSLWSRFIVAFKNALRRWGFRTEFTDTDLAEIIRGAWKAAEGTGKRYSEAGVGQQAFDFKDVFHGSPHVWKPELGFPHGRPKLDKIGTGEGAAAYGWGWYSADAQGVAQGYAQRFSEPTIFYDDKPIAKGYNYFYKNSNSDESVLEAAGILYNPDMGKEFSLNKAIDYGDYAKQFEEVNFWRKVKDKLSKDWDKFSIKRDTGSLYKLDLPDSVIPKLLDWDKPLKDQSEAVQKLLAKIPQDIFPRPESYTKKPRISLSTGETIRYKPEIDPRGSISGREFYYEIAANLAKRLNEKAGSDMFRASDKAASEYLASIGIPGNKYLDGMSRGKGMKWQDGLPNGWSYYKDSSGGFGIKNDRGLKMTTDHTSEAAAHRHLFGDKPTSNYVIWDQPTLDKIALLERNGEKLDAIRDAEKAGDVTETPAFKKWFAGSKVVDEDGKPLVVYHGTTRGFDAFDMSKATTASFHPTSDAGFFFSSDSEIGSYFTEEFDQNSWPPKIGHKKGANIMPVYLNISNPKIISAREFMERFVTRRFYGDKGETFKSWSRKGGYDGVLIKGDQSLAESMGGDEYKGDTYVAFSPNQIKSATGNRGSFDPTDPRIDYKTEGANIPQTLLDRLTAIHDKVDAFIFGRGTHIELNELQMPAELRGGGLGSKFMNILTDYADKTNQPIYLAARGDFGGDQAKQMAFYRRHGFVENPDVGAYENMVRMPDNTIDYSDSKTGKENRLIATSAHKLLKGFGKEGKKRRKEGEGSTAWKPGGKPDVSWYDRIISLPMYYFEKVPQMREAFAKVQQFKNEKYKLQRKLAYNEHGQAYADIQKKFRAKNPVQDKLITSYIEHRNLYGGGYKIERIKDKTNLNHGRFEIITPEPDTFNGKVGVEWPEEKRVFEKWSEAANRMIEMDGEHFQALGGSPEAAEVFQTYRVMAVRMLDVSTQEMQRFIREAEEAGSPEPEIVVKDDDGKVKKVRLSVAIAMMGDLIGSYYPRRWKSGRYLLWATKAGEHKELHKFDLSLKYDEKEGWRNFLKKNAPLPINLKAMELEKKGYTITLEQSDALPESVFLQVSGQKMAIEQLVMKAMENWSTDSKRTLADIGISTKKLKDGTIVIHGEGLDPKNHPEILEELGGVYKYVSTASEGYPSIQFANPQDGLLDKIKMHLFDYRALKSGMEASVATGILSEIADIFKSRGGMVGRIKRTGAIGKEVVTGYEADPIVAFAKATMGLAGSVAKGQLAHELLKIQSGRSETWKEYKERIEDTRPGPNEEGVVFQKAKYADYLALCKERAIDPAEQPNAYRDIQTYINDVLRNEEQVDRVMGTFQGLSTLMFLAGKVSSAAINMSSLATSVPASMTGIAKIPLLKAPALLTKAIGAYRRYKFGKPESLDNWEREAMLHIEKNGWDEQQFNHEAMSALQSKAGHAYQKFLEYAMLPFGVTERINRVATILGTYNGIREMHKGAWLEEDHLKALELAKFTSDHAHGDYSKANRSMLTRGGTVGSNVARMALVFKMYGHNFLANMAYLGFKQKDYKALAYMAISPMVIAGAGAGALTPIIAMFLKAVGVGGDDPEEEFYKWLEKETGQTTAAFVRSGVVGMGGYGPSLTGSMEINMMELPHTIGDLFGAPGGVAKNIYDGVQEFGHGNVMKGLEKVLPTAAGSPIKAYRESTEGLTTRKNTPIFYGKEQVKLTNWEAAMRAFSFNPSRIATIREKQYSEKKTIARSRERLDEIYMVAKKVFLKPYDKRSEKDIANIVAMMNEYNEWIKKDETLSKAATPLTWKRIMAGIKRNTQPSKFEKSREIVN